MTTTVLPSKDIYMFPPYLNFNEFIVCIHTYIYTYFCNGVKYFGSKDGIRCSTEEQTNKNPSLWPYPKVFAPQSLHALYLYLLPYSAWIFLSHLMALEKCIKGNGEFILCHKRNNLGYQRNNPRSQALKRSPIGTLSLPL